MGKKKELAGYCRRPCEDARNRRACRRASCLCYFSAPLLPNTQFRHTKCCFENQKLRQVMSHRKVLSSMRQAKIDQAQRYEETIEALRRAEQKYRSIFENAVEGIFQTTPDGKYISANSALAQMYGYGSSDELVAALTDISTQLYVDPNRRAEFQHWLYHDETV